MCRSGSGFLLMTLGGVSQTPSQAFTDSQPMCPEQGSPMASPQTRAQGPMASPQTRVQGAHGESSDQGAEAHGESSDQGAGDPWRVLRPLLSAVPRGHWD